MGNEERPKKETGGELDEDVEADVWSSEVR